MIELIKNLSRRQKRIILLATDIVLVPVALIFAYAVQVVPRAPVDALQHSAPILPYLMILAALTSNWLGIPRIRLNAYEIRAIGKTAVLSAYLVLGASILAEVALVGTGPRFYIVFGLIYFLMGVSSRLIMREILIALYRRAKPTRRVLIYGAGATGTQLAQAFASHDTIDPIAFVDDNSALQGLTVAGLPVYASVNIKDLVTEKSIDRVLLAVPSLSPPKQMQIARRLEKLGLEVQMLPSFSQLIGEEALLDKLTPVSAGNFLGRAQGEHTINDGMHAYRQTYGQKTVLVTGAGGSIGSEICRQILSCAPKRVVLFELSELALYTVEMEIRQLAEDSDIEIVPILGSITDEDHVRNVFTTHNVEVVLHAAAYKHVPLVEQNPLAGLANNVFGTQVLAREAAESGVERFILISSDKAVRPTNVMGASKRLAELVVQDLATRSTGTLFSTVRFGNVLGSSGSVVPLFQDQISRGGPVTLTHDNVTRYFMTIQEAVHLVLMAGSFAEGGEVFVLDMGRPVPIRDLARQVIEAAGYSVRDERHPEGDIEIIITGLRPGEKLHEELTLRKGQVATDHEKIFSVREEFLSEIEIASAMRALRAAISSRDTEAALSVIKRWVEGQGAETSTNVSAEPLN